MFKVFGESVNLLACPHGVLLLLLCVVGPAVGAGAGGGLGLPPHGLHAGAGIPAVSTLRLPPRQ